MTLPASPPISLNDIYNEAVANGYGGSQTLSDLIAWQEWSNLPTGSNSILDFLGAEAIPSPVPTFTMVTNLITFTGQRIVNFNGYLWLAGNPTNTIRSGDGGNTWSYIVNTPEELTASTDIIEIYGTLFMMGRISGSLAIMKYTLATDSWAVDHTITGYGNGGFLEVFGGELYFTSGTPYSASARVHKRDSVGNITQIWGPPGDGGHDYHTSLRTYGGKMYWSGADASGQGDVYQYDGSTVVKVLDTTYGASRLSIIFNSLYATFGYQANQGDVYKWNGSSFDLVLNTNQSQSLYGASIGTAGYIGIGISPSYLYKTTDSGATWSDSGAAAPGGGYFRNVLSDGSRFYFFIAGGSQPGVYALS